MNRPENSRQARLEVHGLPALRRAAGKTQTEIADALRIKQPSVSKMETQRDMLLSTLKSYVRAIGGEVEVTVRLPGRRAMHLRGLGKDGPGKNARPKKRATRARRGVQVR